MHISEMLNNFAKGSKMVSRTSSEEAYANVYQAWLT